MTNKHLRLGGAIISGLVTVGGEFYYKRLLHDEAGADFFLVLGILAIVAFDQFIGLFGKDCEDVLARLDKVVPAPDDESVNALESFRDKAFHHYHLTENKSGKSIWIYKVIKFERRLSGRTLVGWGPIMPNAQDNPEDHIYKFELSVDGEHLLMQAHHREGRSDMGFEVIPHFGIPRPNYTFPVCGVRMINTFRNEIATTISLLSNGELDCVKGKKSGAPIDDENSIRALEREWEEHNRSAKLSRLPLFRLSPQPTPDIEILPVGRWDSTTVEALLLANTVKGDEVRIWSTFFVHDSGMESITRQLVDKGVKLRIMMMNPSNEDLVRSRFRLRKGYMQNPPDRAQHKIRDHISMLRNIGREYEDSGCTEAVEVRECDTMPFASFYQIGNRLMVLGLLLTEETWEKGPLLKVSSESVQWANLKRSWEVSWASPLDCQCENSTCTHQRGRCRKPLEIGQDSASGLRSWAESDHMCKECLMAAK
jgi:hypothetical protein